MYKIDTKNYSLSELLHCDLKMFYFELLDILFFTTSVVYPPQISQSYFFSGYDKIHNKKYKTFRAYQILQSYKKVAFFRLE